MGSDEISKEQFSLMQSAISDDPRILAVMDFDLDEGVVTTAKPELEEYRSYSLHDVSVAAYKAYRGDYYSSAKSAEIFADAGFQKYLIQHEFRDDTDREESTTIAFWSNFIFSIFLWLLIAIFDDQIASLVGNPDLGAVLTIACVSIPLAAFSSIQMALFKRDFEFKTLFKVRIVGIMIPIFVTIPLAIWLRSYWALVIGTIVQNLSNAILLTVFSKWKPRWFYSFDKFKEMTTMRPSHP